MESTLHRGLSCFIFTAAIIALPCQAQTDAIPSSSAGTEQAGALTKLRSAIPVMPCERPAWSREAIHRRMTGTVTMKFLIDTDGTVLEKEIVKSSGYKMQDKAALEATARCKLAIEPQGGQLKKEWVLLQYVWTLD
jgi:bla regulator protein blaR1